MIKMTDTDLFLDSNIWIAYFLFENSEATHIIDSEENNIFTSVISIHEVFKRLRQLKQEEAAKKAIEFMEETSTIIPIDKEIALSAANNCEKFKLHTIDSLIYTSSEQTNAKFITTDHDFLKTPNTKIIEIAK